MSVLHYYLGVLFKKFWYTLTVTCNYYIPIMFLNELLKKTNLIEI